MKHYIKYYNETEKQLLNNYQRDFPLCSRPFAEIADELGVEEHTVIEQLQQLQDKKTISRVGPVFRVNTVGSSCLAAIAVPDDELEEVAKLVNSYAAVNHNYEREHRYNLWFVLTAQNEENLQAVLSDIEARTGLDVLFLPMLEDYHIDLGFELQWV